MSTEAQGFPQDHFDSIRPFYDHEASEKFVEIISDPELDPLLPSIFPNKSKDELLSLKDRINSISDFKEIIGITIINRIIAETTFSVSSSGKSKLPTDRKCLFISNHRDIILDSAFLNFVLHDAGKGLPRIAIGDNLLIRPWIEKLVRLADAFIVKRTPSVREMLKESMLLSQYIRHTITNNEESVWLAQREGRAKDSDDKTQPALLKMLSMSGDRNPIAALSELNIVPLAISYEYDPCDYLKATELLKKKINPEFKKSPLDDYENMQTGLTGKKGRVHLAFAGILEGFDEITKEASNKQEQFALIAEALDKAIYLNYRIYPNNYVAHDLLYGTKQFKDLYSESDRLQFELYIEEQIKKIIMKGKDKEFLKTTLLTMYANPLVNQLKAKGIK